MGRLRAILITMLLTSAAAPGGAQPAAPKPCQSVADRQFDFWIGRWTVVATGTTAHVADSLIEALYGGCAIRENWMPVKGAGGGSLSSYVPKDGGWKQTWVDGTGARVDFAGHGINGGMMLEGMWPNILGPGKDALVRMTYTSLPDGSVRQEGQTSDDNGKIWKPSFDFTYLRDAKPRP